MGKPHGPWMARLRQYVDADISGIDDLIRRWTVADARFIEAAELLKDSAKRAEDGFSSSSFSGVAGRRNLEHAAAETELKHAKLSRARADEPAAAAVHR